MGEDPPVPLTVDRLQRGPRLRPATILAAYDDKEWESFIKEWASTREPLYASVRQFGGSGDRGIDIAGFETDRGFEGVWDGFQAKHYGSSLGPSVAWPEILKMILLRVDTPSYTVPRKYVFLAPRGVTTKLAHLLESPTEMRAAFLAQLDKPSSEPFRTLTDTRRTAVRAMAVELDFSVFGSYEASRLVDDVRGTPSFATRFGGPLPDRSRSWSVPPSVQTAESEYVAALLEAYREKFPGEISDIGSVAAHEASAPHFMRQREAFFRAESLREFARDSVPSGTYEGLQDEIYEAVIETVASDHADGLTRLRGVLDAAVQAQLTSNALITVLEPGDRKGVCHQLANGRRVRWVR